MAQGSFEWRKMIVNAIADGARVGSFSTDATTTVAPGRFPADLISAEVGAPNPAAIVDWGDERLTNLQVEATALGGTTPSYVFKLQQGSRDSAGVVQWWDVQGGALSAITAPGFYTMSGAVPTVGDNLRVVATATGTAPTFTGDIIVIGTSS